jgi:hypothetical protein
VFIVKLASFGRRGVKIAKMLQKQVNHDFCLLKIWKNFYFDPFSSFGGQSLFLTQIRRAQSLQRGLQFDHHCTRF